MVIEVLFMVYTFDPEINSDKRLEINSDKRSEIRDNLSLQYAFILSVYVKVSHGLPQVKKYKMKKISQINIFYLLSLIYYL